MYAIKFFEQIVLGRQYTRFNFNLSFWTGTNEWLGRIKFVEKVVE